MRPDHLRRKAGLSALVLIGAVALSRAEGRDACRRDPQAQKICGTAGSYPERLHCLHEHKDKLSPACQEHLSHMEAAGEKFREECEDYIEKLCPHRQGHALIDCLEDNSAQIQGPCADRLRKIKEERQEVKERIAAECKSEAETLCLKAPPGGINACLKGQPKLSAACRAAIEKP
jgi:hypothetical protein